MVLKHLGQIQEYLTESSSKVIENQTVWNTEVKSMNEELSEMTKISFI